MNHISNLTRAEMTLLGRACAANWRGVVLRLGVDAAALTLQRRNFGNILQHKDAHAVMRPHFRCSAQGRTHWEWNGPGWPAKVAT